MHLLRLILGCVLMVLAFSASLQAQLRIVQPSTGATLIAGQTTAVEWINQPVNSSVTLQQFVYNEWTTVATNIASPYLWTVPQTTQSISLRLTATVAEDIALLEEYPNTDIETFHTAFETSDALYMVSYGFAVIDSRKEDVVRVWEMGSPGTIVNEFRETVGDPSYNDLKLYSHGTEDSLLFTVGDALRIMPITSNIGNIITIPGMDGVYAIAVHPTEPIIAVCDRNGGTGIRVYNMEQRAVVAQFQAGEATPMYSISFSADGRFLLYGSQQTLVVREWENEVDGSPAFAVVQPLQGFVKDIAMTSQADIVRISTFSGWLYEVNLIQSTVEQIGVRLQSQAWQIDVREDGDRTLASALLSTTSTTSGDFFQFSGDNPVPLSQTAHGGRLYSVAYSNDKLRIVSAGGRDNQMASEPAVIRVWSAGEWYQEETSATFDVQVQAQIVLPNTTANAGDLSAIYVALVGAEDVLESNLDLQFRVSFTYPSQLWFPQSDLVVEHNAISLGRNEVTIEFTPQDVVQDSLVAIEGVALLGRPIRDALLWTDVQVIPQLIGFAQVQGDYGIFEDCFTDAGPYPRTTIQLDDERSDANLVVRVLDAPEGGRVNVCDLKGRRLCDPQSLQPSEMFVELSPAVSSNMCIVFVTDASGNVVAHRMVIR